MPGPKVRASFFDRFAPSVSSDAPPRIVEVHLVRSRLAPIYGLAVLSGAVALVYEIVFFRALGLVFGVAVHAAAAVVAAFLGGLGVGAWTGGRWLSRGNPLRIYAALELSIAVCGYVAPFLFEGLKDLSHRGALSGDDPGAFPTMTLALAFVIVLPPTALMGATFPVLGRAVAGGARDVARRIGWLYGLNTIGAFAGTLLAAYAILPTLGLIGTAHLAAGANVVLGVLSLVIARRQQTPSGAESESADRPPKGLRDPARKGGPGSKTEDPMAGSVPLLALLVAALGMGFSAVAFQVLGNRLLISLVGGSVYAFAIVLAVFLLGIGGGGALLSGRVGGSRQPFRALSICAAATAAGPGVGLLVLTAWVRALADTEPGRVPFADMLAGAMNSSLGVESGSIPLAWQAPAFAGMTFLAAAVVFLPATFASGAILPALARFLGSGERSLSRGLGSIYLWNTLGSICGSLVAGFFLLPHFGLRTSLWFAAGAALITAGILAWTGWRRGEAGAFRWPSIAGAAAVLALFLGLAPGRPNRGGGEFEAVFYAEAEASAVKVIEFYDPAEGRDVRSLAVNGKVVASSRAIDQRLQYLLGFIPTLIHEDPKRILSIALGTGMSSAALAVTGAKQVEIVELSQGVIDACYTFDEWTHQVLERKNVTCHVADGRRFLTRSQDLYDLITADPIHPWVAGSAYLYTVEYYGLAARHLAEGGIMTQWVPLYNLSTEDVAGITRSFGEVFPHVSAWLTGYDMILVGSNEPMIVDAARIQRRMQRQPTRSMLASCGVYSPADLLACHFAGDAVLREFGELARGPITDDRPWIEFTAPWSLFESYPLDVYRMLVTAGDAVPLPDDTPEALRDSVRHANRQLREATAQFIDDLQVGGDRAATALNYYTDVLLVGYRDGE